MWGATWELPQFKTWIILNVVGKMAQAFKKPIVGYASLITMVLILSACDNHDVKDSSDVATSDISAYINVKYDGSQVVSIEANLKTSSYTQVKLVDGDILRVSTLGDLSQLHYSDNLYDRLLVVSEQVKTLDRVGSGSDINYYTTMDAKYHDKEFTVALFRDKKRDAPNTVLQLPPDFSVSIDQAQSGTPLSRSGPMTVRWTPANPGYSMQISGFVNCSNGDHGGWYSGSFVNQTDSYDIAANTFSGFTGNCTVTIDVESSNSKKADPAFRFDSSIHGHQTRSIAVETVE
jgi:hypothetical protein